MEKVIFFDFCDTLVNMQTANAFVEFVLKDYPKKAKRMRIKIKIIAKLKIRRILQLFFPDMSFYKQMRLLALKGITCSELEAKAEMFYNQIVKSNLIAQTIQELNDFQNSDDTVVIVSAGYEIYLKYFCKDYGINHLFATEFEFKDDVFTGHCIGKDCIEQEKVKRIKDFDNFDYKVCFSDSDSDLPLFQYCDERIAVLNKEKYNDKIPVWVEEINAKVIWH
ncbi:MAG: HAD-IB family hydrolase [Clostridia bacterium]|nr:HAD-IB family hydrolase [Clostridia bacterium]